MKTISPCPTGIPYLAAKCHADFDRRVNRLRVCRAVLIGAALLLAFGCRKDGSEIGVGMKVKLDHITLDRYMYEPLMVDTMMETSPNMNHNFRVRDRHDSTRVVWDFMLKKWDGVKSEQKIKEGKP